MGKMKDQEHLTVLISSSLEPEALKSYTPEGCASWHLHQQTGVFVYLHEIDPSTIHLSLLRYLKRNRVVSLQMPNTDRRRTNASIQLGH